MLRRLAVWAANKVSTHLDRDGVLLFWVLRRLKVVVSTKVFALVVRDVDVREVLARHETFTVEPYERIPSVMGGDFVLGIDAVAQHGRERGIIALGLRPEDIGRVAKLAAEVARDRMAEAFHRGQIDIVADLADPVLDQVVGEYLGTPGPGAGTLVNWSRLVFREVFINQENDPHVRQAAMTAAGQMTTHLNDLIAARKLAVARHDPPTDVLGRLLQAQRDGRTDVTDSDIRRNLLGLAVAWIPNTSKTVALAVDELLRRPEQFVGAQRAAREDDDLRLAAYVFEALRFRPQNLGILRRCAHDHRLASGAMIRSGALVLAVTKSAMMDGDAIDAPRGFRLDRRWGEYLHFGYGFHTCAGEQLSRAVIPALIKPLLQQNELHRARGRSGRVSWKGPYPGGLTVDLTTR
ncbi:MAG: cytochrome P450 [Acidimicrobiales bacterium]